MDSGYMMEYRNAKYTAQGTIVVEIEHPVLGWIPFHATPEDEEEHGRAMFEELRNVAVAYVPPEA